MNAKTSIVIAVVLLMGLVSAEANLLANGDFEQGNTGFESSYVYAGGNAGSYFIGDNSKDWNGNFPAPGLSDHTSGSGLMFMADGVQNLLAWKQTVSVDAGMEYQFSGWYSGLYNRFVTPRLEFLVDGDSLGNVIGTFNTWEQFSQTWTAVASGDVILTIRDTASGDIGNDFALDDLVFEAIPEPAAASLFGLSTFGAIWIRRRRRFKGCFMFIAPSAGISFDAARKSKVDAAPKKIRISLPQAVASPVACSINESRQRVHSKMIATEDAFYGLVESTHRSVRNAVRNAAKRADRAFWNLFI